MYFYENVLPGYRGMRDKSLGCVDIMSFVVVVAGPGGLQVGVLLIRDVLF